MLGSWMLGSWMMASIYCGESTGASRILKKCHESTEQDRQQEQGQEYLRRWIDPGQGQAGLLVESSHWTGAPVRLKL
jgi:hypothetical protein